MNRLILLTILFLAETSLWSQGTVLFSTWEPYLIGTEVNAQVRRADGTTGAGAGYNAELVMVAGSAITPLTPRTVFRSGTAADAFYVVPVVVDVPGVPSGTAVTLMMRAFQGTSWESSSPFRGQSLQLNVVLGGGALPPGKLIGLGNFVAFVLPDIPEPSITLLSLICVPIIFACLVRQRNKRQKMSQLSQNTPSC